MDLDTNDVSQISGSGSTSPLPAPPNDLISCLKDRVNSEQKLLRGSITAHSYGSFQHDTRVQESSKSLDTTQPIFQNHATPGEGNRGVVELAHAEGVTPKWDEAFIAGQTNATWWRESQFLIRSSFPLMVTFSLQYSLNIASVLSAGNLGKNELAAVSLAGMTGSITGYAVFQGTITYCTYRLLLTVGTRPSYISRYLVRTSLWWRAKDTRWVTHAAHVLFSTGCRNTNFSCMVYMSNIAQTWGKITNHPLHRYFAEHLLNLIIPDRELTALAGSYLRVLIFGLWVLDI